MSTLQPSVFKAYDIRGIYPTEIDADGFADVIKAIYTFFLGDLKKESLTVSLSRDMRLSGPTLYEVAKKALLEMGATVVDLGLASTPTYYFALANYGYDIGIQISASHNPKDYTGIKFAKMQNGQIVKIGKASGMEEVKKIALSKQFAGPKSGGKVVQNSQVLEDEINSTLKIVDQSQLKKFRIALDPANAMGCIFLNELFKKVPADLEKINFELDGTFPAHEPNPYVFKNLKSLQEKVLETKADVGISTDGDGDRVMFIDEKGHIIQPTAISSIVAHSILKKHPGEKIIADIRDIRNVQEVCKRYGGQFLMSIVGHAFITAQLNREGAAFAGESSGHYFFRETGGAESSMRVIMYILAAMSEEGKPLSEIVKEYVTSAEHEEINFVVSPPADTATILAVIEKHYADSTISKEDGLTVQYPDWRANMRTSNTESEPILRLNIEGATMELVNAKFEEIKGLIAQNGGKLKE